MQYLGALLTVKDMEKSKKFYHDVLGLNIAQDFGANGIFLQTLDTWKSFIRTDNVLLPHNAGELYFEEENLSGFCGRLMTYDIQYVHPLMEHRWGQRVIRFYDPDGHIIEVGEKMDAVVRRFVRQGLSAEETAERMDVPLEYVQNCLKEK